MITIDDLSDGPEFGRIATFTYPELSHDALDSVRREAGVRTAYTRVGALAALGQAIREFDGTVHSGRRLFHRQINSNTYEFISEAVVGDRGERETLTSVTTRGFEAYNEAGVAFIELFGDSIQSRARHHMTHVTSALVSDWAERVVIREFGGFGLANRGHSIHVRGAHVRDFDRFIRCMADVSGGRELVQVFKTLDTDPASMGSLLASIRARVDEAVNLAEKRVVSVRTARGINSVLDGLISVRAQIEAYRDLLGVSLDGMVQTLDKASEVVSGAEIVKSFGGLS